DSLNSAAGGNFLDKMPRECLKIIESKYKVRQTRAKAVVAKIRKNQSSAPASSSTPTLVKAVEPNCVTCDGTHSYQNCPATSENVYRGNIQEYVSQAAAANYNQGHTGFRPQMVPNQIRPPDFPPRQNNQNNFNRGNNFNQNRGGSGTLPSNTITNPKEDLKGITTRSGVAYQGPIIPTPSKQGTEVTKDQVQTPSSQSTAPVQPPVVRTKTQTPVSKPVVAPVSVLMPNLKTYIPYPSRRNNERRHDQANEQIEKFYEIFKDMSFEISFTIALILMPKFASTLKALIGNKEKLSEMSRSPMNEHCSAVILNKLPRKLGDPGKFLIPCEFLGMDECLALADLGKSINLMPLFVWEGLSLPKLTPSCMTLELADRSVSKPIGIAKDVSVKVGVFHFPADFVVVDFEPDPRVSLILSGCFLKTGRALINVHKGELTLHIRNKAITYNLDQTLRYSANYNQMTTNKIDVICEEYSQEVLSFLYTTASGNPTPHDDPIVSTTSPTLTPFGDSDFLLFEEPDAFLGLEDDPNSPKINPFYNDPEGDILLLEAILNSEPLPPIPNHEQYFPSSRKNSSPWVSPVHCVPKKGGFTVIENEENELIPTRLLTGWRDSLNFAAGGNFLDKMPADCLKIIESKSKVRQARAKAVVAKVNSSSSTPAISSDVTELKDMVRALLREKKNQYSAPAPSPTPAPIKAVEPNCVTCGGSGTLHGNTITNPKEDLKGITTQSGVAYQGPTIPTLSKVAKQGTEVTKDQVQTPSSQSTAPVQPSVAKFKTPVSEPVVAPVSASMPNLKPSIPYPSRRDNERCRDQANEQIEKFYEIFKDMSFEISFTNTLILMPKFASTLKALIGNKEKLSEMARTPMNEHCLAIILNKLPKKLRDPGKFLIPCEFPGMDECLTLADLGASINLMPLSMWKGLLLPELTPTCMTLELADRSVSKPIGIAKDVSVKVGVFHFPTDFVVVDFKPDTRVPLILRRCFLKTEYSQEVLGFFDVTASGSPTPSIDPIISTTSPTFTPFGDSDFLLFEEADAFLGLEDDPDSPEFDPSEFDPSYYDSEEDILLLEAILKSDPSPPLSNHEQSVPSFKKELKACEAKTIKSSIDEPPEVELKDLPPHLEY
nr:reverse transcriptase domain-containing protein [Tanacetum cinerariifolium]